MTYTTSPVKHRHRKRPTHHLPEAAMQLLTSPRVVADGRLLAPGWVLMDETVREYGEGQPPARAHEAATAVRTLDTGVLAPGLVDIQINGAFGADFAAADDDGWAAVARSLTTTGTTAFLPTLITAPVEDLAAALRGYRDRRGGLAGVAGAARSLGVHLEGPFLAESRRGAHRADLL
ncbi:MAG: hypothetical protein ACRDOJ_06300, partial [Nocardioidaceae bacterium]